MSTDPSPQAGLSSLRASGSRAIREPLFQFLLVAIVLFTLNSLLNGGEAEGDGQTITIPEGRVLQIAESYRLMSGRAPSRTELEALIADYADEEIAAREAAALGLDADDTIIRRRLQQKLTFLVEDSAATSEPTAEDLAAYFEAHREDYILPARLAFRQIMVSPDKRGDTAPAEAAAILEELKAGTNPTSHGDPSMLPKSMTLSPETGIAMVFGQSFAATLFASDKEGWFGPVRSPIGLHLVEITSREPARMPAFAEIEAQVAADWMAENRAFARSEFEEDLRERYDVTIEWPEAYRDGPAGE
ncbi:peptidyl-prolyl cis-trans isomerase [Parvularcula marina]|nr:peptidylprolyl isomerase [Parvularcula marina]